MLAVLGLIAGVVGALAALGSTLGHLKETRGSKAQHHNEAVAKEQARIEQLIAAFADQPETPFSPGREGVLRRLSRVEGDLAQLRALEEALRSR